MKHVQVMLLQDMRPPWLLHSFPQSLAGGTVLNCWTHPTFIHWDMAHAWRLFNKGVEETLTRMAKRVLTLVARVVARPFYVCTQTKTDGNVCMSKAALSPLVEERVARRSFLCHQCKASGPPISDNAALRILLLHIVMKTGVDITTFLAQIH